MDFGSQGGWVKSHKNNKFVLWGSGYLTGSWCIGYFGLLKEFKKKRTERQQLGVGKIGFGSGFGLEKNSSELNSNL